MTEQSELDEIVLPRGNPVELSDIGSSIISPEDVEDFAERERILNNVRESFRNRHGEQAQDEWGMVVGRFQPFTKGHGILLDAGDIAAKNLLVVLPIEKIPERNPFPPEDIEIMVRLHAKEQGYLGKLQFLYQEDLHSPKEWGEEILQKADERGIKVDVLISNNETPGVTEVFRRLGTRVFETETFKRAEISGTNKRAEMVGKGVLQPGVNRLKLPSK